MSEWLDLDPYLHEKEIGHYLAELNLLPLRFTHAVCCRYSQLHNRERRFRWEDLEAKTIDEPRKNGIKPNLSKLLDFSQSHNLMFPNPIFSCFLHTITAICRSSTVKPRLGSHSSSGGLESPWNFASLRRTTRDPSRDDSVPNPCQRKFGKITKGGPLTKLYPGLRPRGWAGLSVFQGCREGPSRRFHATKKDARAWSLQAAGSVGPDNDCSGEMLCQVSKVERNQCMNEFVRNVAKLVHHSCKLCIAAFHPHQVSHIVIRRF